MQLFNLFTNITCYHFLWNICGMLNFDTLICLKQEGMKDQRTSCGAENKRSSVQQLCIVVATGYKANSYIAR